MGLTQRRREPCCFRKELLFCLCPRSAAECELLHLSLLLLTPLARISEQW